MKRRIGIIFMSLGTVLVLAALSLLLYNQREDNSAGQQSDEMLQSVTSYIEDMKVSDTDTVEEIYSDLLETEMTVVGIDGYNYVGYLSIPALSLELPVMADCNYSLMKIAPCRYSGSSKTDDLVIAAHNYSRHFGKISNIQSGEAVYFTDMDGNTIEYYVAGIEILQPEQVEEMVESEWDLTLYTCTYSGSERVTLRCERN